MGVYNTFQSLGFFVGGVMGGLLSSHFGPSAVFMFGAVLIGVWLVLALGMKPLPAVKNLMFHVGALNTEAARRLEKNLLRVLGVTEAMVVIEEGAVYLKVDGRHLDERALRELLPAV